MTKLEKEKKLKAELESDEKKDGEDLVRIDEVMQIVRKVRFDFDSVFI